MLVGSIPTARTSQERTLKMLSYEITEHHEGREKEGRSCATLPYRWRL